MYLRFLVNRCLFLLLVLLCVSCQHSPRQFLTKKRESLLSQGKSQDFIDGFVEGCSSGRQELGDQKYVFRKDTVRYNLGCDYNIGWEKGRIVCREERIIEIQNAVKQKPYSRAPNAAVEEERRRIWEDLKK